MVLQKSPQRAVVFGYCTTFTGQECSQSSIQLKLDDTIVPTSAGRARNSWIAKLPATMASNHSHTLTLLSITNPTTPPIILKDILFGDVWICSGQSNMAFLLEHAFNGSKYVNASNQYKNLRMFTSFKNNSTKPLHEQPAIEENWTISSPSGVSQDISKNGKTTFSSALDDNWLYMSAVCYLFGVEILKHTKYPIGLVNTNWGGTKVEFWSSAESLASCSDDGSKDNISNGGAYNGMISPLLNMTLYGAIWYQGESNSGDALTHIDPYGFPMAKYGCTFPAMINDWRKKFNEGSLKETPPNFYFGYVELGPWLTPDGGPSEIRWSQSAGFGYVPNPILKENVFNAIAIDLTDRTSPYGSVHIRDKKSVSERLANGGIQVAYGGKNYWQGPTISSAFIYNQFKNSSTTGITIKFDNVGSNGLLLKNDTGFECCSTTTDDDQSNVQNICTVARVSRNTKNTIDILCSTNESNKIDSKLVVRYAWKSLPFEYKAASIYSNEFPAGPFRVVVE